MRFRTLLPILALLAAAALPARAEDLRLTILHTTDLHGSLLSWDDLTDRPVPRGLEKISTLVRAVRGEGGRVLLVDAGDVIQGTPLETLHQLGDRQRPDPMMMAMNAIGYDAMVVGNHEFDFGARTLADARDAAKFPWLAANITHPDGSPAFAASTIKVLDSLRVGIVGVTTPAIAAFTDPQRIGNLKFGSPVDAARAEVAKLRAQHCDVVVLLAHTGLERDDAGTARTGDAPDENWAYRLATEVPGVDALVIGHTHTVVPGRTIGQTFVAQAGARGEGLGRIDLTLSRDRAGEPWKVTTRTGRYLAVADSVASDSAIVTLARADHVIAQDQLGRAIVRLQGPVGAPLGRTADGPLWELVHSVQLRATGADVSLASLADPSLTLGPGPVTVADLFRAVPFENTLVVVELTGAQLKQTLEQSARAWAPYTYEDGKPLLDPAVPPYQIEGASGVSYQIDLTRPVGDRILDLSRNGQALAPDQKLKVVVTSYRASGAGGYDAIRTAPRVSTVNRTVRELLSAALTDSAMHVSGDVDGGWTVVPDWVGLPERPLIDRLVRLRALPAAEIARVYPLEPARRGDFAYWLSRSFDWREKRQSNAYPDLPDSLEPWLDGLLRRKVLRSVGSAERFEPFRALTFREALDWCEGSARSAGYVFPSLTFGDPAYRRSLVTGIDLGAGVGRFVYVDQLTRAQALGMVANVRFPAVRVLETTDFHGAILPGTRDRRTNRAWGGSAVLAAHIARLRAANPEGTVLLDGGDWFQGTMISNLAFGRPVVEQMNALGYAAAAVGNHEFDWTADTLARRVRELRFAALGANMRERKTGRLPRWARSDTTFTRRGLRVSVLGLCYPQTPTVTLPSNVAFLRFDDDSATSVPIVQRLRKNHADVVIGVGHIPAPTDSARRPGGDLARLARGVPGVDVWLGGHSHNQVAGDVNGVPALIAGSHGQFVAVCDLVVDPVAHKAVEHHAWLEPTFADEVTPDSAMAVRMDTWNADVSHIAAEPIGRSTNTLTRSSPENLVGNLVTDAIRSEMKLDIAFQNSGGLRADLPAGVITRGMIYEVMPFDNTIVTMKLSGSEVRQALEEGLRTGRVAQVSGIRYSYDPDAPAMHRVVDVTLADGSPIDPARDYKAAVNNFMAQGGDDYQLFRTARDKIDTQVSVREQLEAYVRDQSKNGATLDVKPEGRIRRATAQR